MLPRPGSDVEFYPDLYHKAAVLVCRLAWNHPLPDGDKRGAGAALVTDRIIESVRGEDPSRGARR